MLFSSFGLIIESIKEFRGASLGQLLVTLIGMIADGHGDEAFV
jgi:hypothetical protein